MCKSVEEYANKKKMEGEKALLFSLVEKGKLSISDAAMEINMPIDKVEQLMLEEGYQIPNLV